MVAMHKASPLVLIFSAALPIFASMAMIGCSSPDPLAGLPELPIVERTPATLAAELNTPIRLTAAGKLIDIGQLNNIAHAGPWIADVDQDGDRDLLVGDFPGYFWFFSNEATDGSPEYASAVKLQAGGEDAKTPVY